MARTRGERGHVLIEALIVLVLSGLLAAMAVPSMAGIWDRSRSRGATREMAALLRAARSRAIAEGRNVAIVFEKTASSWRYALYADGDSDGVRSTDIAAGIDPMVGSWRELRASWPGVDLGFIECNRIRKIPPSSGWITVFDDPLQVGSANIVSFSPQGSASSGTIYITDGRGQQSAIVLYGATSRVRVYRYDTAAEEWVL